MDFHTLSRKELQALCKKNRIPANTTNLAMADSLATLDKVEGLDDLAMASKTEPWLSPKASPRTACRSSTRRNPIIKHEDIQKTIQTGRQAKFDPSDPVYTATSKRRKQPISSSGGTTGLVKNGDYSQVISGGNRAYHTRSSARLLEKGMRTLRLGTKDEVSDGDNLVKKMATAEENHMNEFIKVAEPGEWELIDSEKSNNGGFPLNHVDESSCMESLLPIMEENTSLEISLPAAVEETNSNRACLPPSQVGDTTGARNNSTEALLPNEEHINGTEALLQSEELNNGTEALLQSEELNNGTEALLQSEEDNNGTEALLQSEEDNNVAEALLQSEEDNNVAEALLQSEEDNNVAEALLQSEEDNNGTEALLESQEHNNVAEALLESQEHNNVAEALLESQERDNGTEALLESQEHDNGTKALLQSEEHNNAESNLPGTRLPRTEECYDVESSQSYFEENHCTRVSLPSADHYHLPQAHECNNKEEYYHAYIGDAYYCAEAPLSAIDQAHLRQTQECNNGETSHAYIEECNSGESCHPSIEESYRSEASLSATDQDHLSHNLAQASPLKPAKVNLVQTHLPQTHLSTNKPDNVKQNILASTVLEPTQSQIHNHSAITQNLRDNVSSPFAAETLQGQFPRPNVLPEHKRSELQTRLIKVEDDNVSEKECKHENPMMASVPQLNDLSLRQLTKMLREKLQIKKQSLAEREPLQALNQNYQA